MIAKFADTGLTLEAGHGKAIDSADAVVANLIGAAAGGTAEIPFYTNKEPMVFRYKGSKDGSVVRLNVKIDPTVKTFMVAPNTADAFGKPDVGLPVGERNRIEARRLTTWERARTYAKAEVALTIIAGIVALCALVTTFVAPSAEKKAGRQDLVVRLQPIEQRLAAGISAHDSAAVQQEQAQLTAVLEAKDREPLWISFANKVAKYTAGMLGLVSAAIAFGIARKRATATP